MDSVVRSVSLSLASAENAGGHHNIGWGMFIYLGVILAVMFLLLSLAKAGMRGPVFKNPLTQALEHAYLFIENLCVSVIGGHGRKYVPIVMSLWLIIFFCNMLGLVLPHTPSADWSFTLALAIIVVCYVQYEGVKAHGLVGYIKHFAGPSGLGALALVITPLIFAIEIISEAIRFLSLSVRLYGNIFAGHTAKGTLDEMAPAFPVLGALLFPLEFLVAIIQAFVFVLLTCIYLSLATAHHAEDHEHEQHAEIPHGTPQPSHA